MRPRGRTTRRDFLRRSAAAATGAVAFPYIVPASALGRDGHVAPSERIVMGAIGLGGQGTHIMMAHMKCPGVQMVAVCDVDRGTKTYPGNGDFGLGPGKFRVEDYYRQQSPTGEYKGVEAYDDFRDLLAREDIDAVTICTPDHWHALIAVAAARAGKDIYCEKPLANSIPESRAIVEAVRKHKRILQTGSHERSNDNGRFAAELVRNGRIGRLHTIEINLPCSDDHHKQVLEMNKAAHPEMPVPEGLNWDFWLGHTPRVPYHEKRCHFWWRFILAHGGGEMTDRGAHVIDLGQLGNGTDDTGPIRITAEGTQDRNALFDAFMDYRFECEYANGVRMVGRNGGERGLKFVGERGWIFVHVHGCKLVAEPAGLLEEKIGENEIRLGRSPGHVQNFIDCVRSRQDPMAPAEIGHRTATICHLCNLSMRLGRPLRWDPVREQVIGDEEANRLMVPVMRDPWKL